MLFKPVVLLLALAAVSGAEASIPFEAGKDGYNTFRIPALVRAKDGSLLAFCEGRKNGHQDHGDIVLVLKRSLDQGKTWLPLQLLQDEGGTEPVVMGNPVPVVDASNGRVHLVFCRNNHEIFHSWSDDNGITWSPRKDISEGLTKPDWGWYATGPCHGIQLAKGKQAGRLVIPANHRIGERGDNGPYGGHCIFSDDGGKSWKMGALASEGDGIHPNETTAVELEPAADGGSRIYFNTRNNRDENPLGRASTSSNNGGTTFLAPYRAIPDLDTPAVQGSVLRWSDNKILFTCPRGKKRTDLTLWSSSDEGKTWQVDRLVCQGASAYADMVKTAEGKLAVLYENGGKRANDRISFELLAVE